MKTKSTFLARKALASPTVVARQPQLATGRDGTDLPMPANGGNLTSTSRSSGGCRLMPARTLHEEVSMRSEDAEKFLKEAEAAS